MVVSPMDSLCARFGNNDLCPDIPSSRIGVRAIPVCNFIYSIDRTLGKDYAASPNKDVSSSTLNGFFSSFCIRIHRVRSSHFFVPNPRWISISISFIGYTISANLVADTRSTCSQRVPRLLGSSV